MGRLSERWRAASLDSGWIVPRDWWVPAVDAVAEALGDGRDPAPSCARLGHARAQAGVGLDEAFGDLAALHSVLGRPRPAGTIRVPSARGIDAVPARLVRALALGWAEVACAPAAAGCEDPMTGLASQAYLRTRLGEIYREAERDGLAAPESSAFVLVDPGDLVTATAIPLELARLGRALTVAECLRAVFSGGETLCALRPTRMIALTAREPGLAVRVSGLRRLLGDRLPPGPPVRAWVEGLPATLDGALRLIGELARC